MEGLGRIALPRCQRRECTELPLELRLERFAVRNRRAAALRIDKGVRRIARSFECLAFDCFGHCIGCRHCCMATPIDGLGTLMMVGKARGFDREFVQRLSIASAGKIGTEPEQALLDFWFFEQVLDPWGAGLPKLMP